MKIEPQRRQEYAEIAEGMFSEQINQRGQMDIETLKAHGLTKKGASSDMPFGDDVVVLRVMKKIFALIPLNMTPQRVNLKCDPIWAEVLRQTYPGVLPGWHMNKIT